jgi:DNA-binding transcriptional ArsR family regulator
MRSITLHPQSAQRAPGGDVDLAAVGALFAEPARARMLQALLDGRALPAGVLASEAGVAPSTASAHLARLSEGGLVLGEQHGRHRYYRLAGGGVAHALEALATLAPVTPVRSLRDDTRARALRRARTCYDHLAGGLGVALMGSLLCKGALEGHDGSFRPGVERLSAPGPDECYRLTVRGRELLEGLGVDVEGVSRRPLVRHCVDWSEQRHHLSGRLGASIAAFLFEARWIDRGPLRRSVVVTDRGTEELGAHFGMDTSGLR